MPIEHGDFFCLGVSHKSAQMDFREKLYIPEQRLSELLPIVQKQYNFDEVTVLSTCNRFEMFGLITHSDRSQSIKQAFLDLHKNEKNEPKYSKEELKNNSYILYGSEAIKHIFAVASSLDSLVIGETQITGQFKDSIALAKQALTLGPITDRLHQEALKTAKKVRNQTSISEKTVSISHAAIDLAKTVFKDISQQKFLIIGSGEMGAIAAKHAYNYKPKELYIANRTITTAENLVSEIGFGSAHGMSEVPLLLEQADIVISSTGADHIILSKDLIKNIIKKRSYRSLFLVDIALPRDIDPECSELDDIYLFEIDDLKQIVDTNIQERQQEAHKAVEIINSSVDTFSKWLDSRAIQPALASFNDYLNKTFEKELSKTLEKEIFKSLNEEQKNHIHSLLKAISGRLSADAAKNIRDPKQETSLLGEQLAHALQNIFSLDKLKE